MYFPLEKWGGGRESRARFFTKNWKITTSVTQFSSTFGSPFKLDFFPLNFRKKKLKNKILPTVQKILKTLQSKFRTGKNWKKQDSAHKYKNKKKSNKWPSTSCPLCFFFVVLRKNGVFIFPFRKMTWGPQVCVVF